MRMCGLWLAYLRGVGQAGLFADLFCNTDTMIMEKNVDAFKPLVMISIAVKLNGFNARIGSIALSPFSFRKTLIMTKGLNASSIIP